MPNIITNKNDNAIRSYATLKKVNNTHERVIPTPRSYNKLLLLHAFKLRKQH